MAAIYSDFLGLFFLRRKPGPLCCGKVATGVPSAVLRDTTIIILCIVSPDIRATSAPLTYGQKNIFSAFKHHYSLWINFWRRVNKFINREKYADRVWQNQYNSYSWQAQIEQLNILLSGDTLNFIIAIPTYY